METLYESDTCKKILSDISFIKTIIIRNSSENPECYKSMMKEYQIPIIDIDQHNPWNPEKVLNLVYRLKDIEKNIEWKQDNMGCYNIAAIRFLFLLEKIAGKQHYSKLCCLVWGEC